jgi:hypothetical protein
LSGFCFIRLTYMEVAMRWFTLSLATALAITLPAVHGRAEGAIRVKLDTMSDHEIVEGTVTVASFTIKSKHGPMVVPIGKVKDIRSASELTKEGHVVKLSTVDAQAFVGVITAPEKLEIAGKYGVFRAPWKDVSDLQVLHDPGVTAGPASEFAVPPSVGAGPGDSPVRRVEPRRSRRPQGGGCGARLLIRGPNANRIPVSCPAFGRLRLVRGGGRQGVRFLAMAWWRGAQTDDAIDPFAIVTSPRTFGH